MHATPAAHGALRDRARSQAIGPKAWPLKGRKAARDMQPSVPGRETPR